MIAFAFCGKIGTYRLQSRHAAKADHKLIRESYESFSLHLLKPASQFFDHANVFLHSWNPDAEMLLRELYQPVQAEFETAPNGWNQCPDKSDCLRVYSHLKSIHKVLNMVFAHNTYDYVYLSRFDILWKVAFDWSILPHDKYVLPQYCSPLNTGHFSLHPHNTSSDTKCRPLFVTSLEDHRCTDFVCRFNKYLRNRAVMDTWIVGNTSLMKDFASIGLNTTFEKLSLTLKIHRPVWTTSHVYWGVFLDKKPVRYVNYNQWIDWTLTRYPNGLPPHRKFPICSNKKIRVFEGKCEQGYYCTRCG